jgi:hypothetical protein
VLWQMVTCVLCEPGSVFPVRPLMPLVSRPVVAGGMDPPFTTGAQSINRTFVRLAHGSGVHDRDVVVD